VTPGAVQEDGEGPRGQRLKGSKGWVWTGLATRSCGRGAPRAKVNSAQQWDGPAGVLPSTSLVNLLKSSYTKARTSAAKKDPLPNGRDLLKSSYTKARTSAAKKDPLPNGRDLLKSSYTKQEMRTSAAWKETRPRPTGRTC
jgi:hypothetical protein